MVDEMDRKGQYERVEQDRFYADHMKYIKSVKRRNIFYNICGAIGILALGAIDYSMIKSGSTADVLVAGILNGVFLGTLIKMRGDNKRYLSQLEAMANELKEKK